MLAESPFIALVSLLAARALMAEPFAFAQLNFLQGISSDSGPTHILLTYLDALLLVIATLAAFQSPPRWVRQPWLLGAMLALLAAVVVSTLAANDQRVALNAGASLFATVLAGLTLHERVDSRARRNVIIAALVAIALTHATKSVMQWSFEFSDTIAYWNEVTKPAWLAQGMSPDDPAIVNYERRLHAQEPFGHLAHPNVAAAVMLMGVLPLAGLALGLMRSAKRDPKPAVLAIGLFALGALAIGLTGSIGGIGALLVGLVLLAGGGGALRGDLARSPLRWLLAGAALYVSIMAAIAVVGLVRGTLPHPSLAFRWTYWMVAVQSWLEHPLTGLGRENFIAAFMRLKPAAFTEEVRNPHNLWISLLVELGPLGLVAGVILIMSAAWVVLRGAARALTRDEVEAAGMHQQPMPPVIALSAITACGMLLANYIFARPTILWATDVVLPYTAVFGLTLYLLNADRSADAWLRLGALAALAGALLLALVGFAAAAPAGLAMLSLLSASQQVRTDDAPPRVSRLQRTLTPVALAVLTVVHCYAVAWRTTAESRDVDRAIAVLTSMARANQRSDWRWTATTLDADGPQRVAGAALQLGANAGDARVRDALLDAATSAAQAAKAINPNDVAHARMLARIAEIRAGLAERRGDAAAALEWLRNAAGHWREARRLYPTEPRIQLNAGLALAKLYELSGDDEDRARARACLDRALAIDATRPSENAAKLSEAELMRIRAALDQLRPTGA